MRLTLLALIALPSLGFAQGALTPPGAPAPAMKSLDQIEARTVIGAVGGSFAAISIDSAGSYVLLGNLSVRAGSGITINADNVTLDLNGFTISSSANPAAGNAIYLPAGRQNIVVRNGHIGGSGTVNASTGAFSGTGFNSGIYCSQTLNNCSVSDLTISSVAAYGIWLDLGSIIDRCAATHCGYTGIRGQTVTNCSSTSCGKTAIQGTTVSNSQGASVTDAGISATTASNCIGTSTSGIGLKAAGSAINCTGTTQTGTYGLRVATDDAPPVEGTAENCKGTAAGGTGTGLSAGSASNCIGQAVAGSGVSAGQSALNCHGQSSTGTGLSAGQSATNCHGSSIDGDGLFTSTADTCSGSSISGYGLRADIASNSSAFSNSGTGLDCTAAASNCKGESTSGVGLSARNSTNCNGRSSTGDMGLRAYGTANGCTGNRPSGIALRATIAIGCNAIAGTIEAPSKYNMP